MLIIFFKGLSSSGLLMLVVLGFYFIIKNGPKMLIPFFSLKYLTKKEWLLVLMATLVLFVGGLGEYLLTFYSQ